jgi:ribonuclease E
VSTLPSATTPATETAAVKPAAAADESAPQAAAAAGEPAPRAAAAAKVVTRPPAGARRATRSYAIALAAIVIVLAALALRRPMPADAPGTADPRPQSHEGSTDRDSNAQPIVAASTATPAFRPTAAPVANPIAATRAAGESPKNTPARPAKNLAAVSSAPIPAATPVAETRAKEDSPADAEPTGTVPASALSTTETAALAHVTITGCLEISTDEDRFRLTDTDGASAPKSRSWRTGFLKKRSAPVDLVGPSDTLALQKQVGKRVAATGVLMSRELKVTSVRTVSPSCN